MGMAEPDAALIAAAQAGDRRAIDELLARYEERIYRFGLRMCGDEESAREVLQETVDPMQTVAAHDERLHTIADEVRARLSRVLDRL